MIIGLFALCALMLWGKRHVARQSIAWALLSIAYAVCLHIAFGLLLYRLYAG